ncbi:GntR family transcriptional regulator [Chelativorans sp.]|uniref:GntR family transcriptional regulator n=1 Tax=Chelativorans sp. TaxID=2203393 RepID=UPI002810C46D|nr:GntR family transcriptional regulator [Chelativorans sp.]
MSKVAPNTPTYIRISDLIRKDIFAGAFVAGQRLKVLELANRYATSQMPIREALHILQGEGLVQVLPNRGAVVQAIDEKFLSDHYDMLKALEMLLVRQAAEAVTPEAIPLLRGEADRFRKAADKGETAPCLQADKRFHRAINRFSKNDLALSFVERQSKVPDAQRLRVGYSGDRLQQAAAEHDQLVQALSRNDGEEATRIMDAHLTGAKHDLFERLAETHDVRFGGSARRRQTS